MTTKSGPVADGVCSKSTHQIQHKHPCTPQYQPYPDIKPTYDTKAQYAEATDEFSPFDKENFKIFQEVTGTLLYYASH